MLNFYPKMYYSGGGGGGGGDAGGGGAGGSSGGAAGSGVGGAAGSGGGIGGLRVNNVCGEGGRNAYNGSVFFDGNNSFLSLDSGAVPSFGTDSFTIEFWINQGVNTSDYTILISLYASTNAKRFEVAFHSGTIQVYTDTGAWRDTGYAPVSGVFEHIAFQRDSSGNTLKMYANGVETWSVSNTRDYDEPWSTKIGSYNLSSTGHFQGYISNLRICAAHLIYFSNYFSPPTSPLTLHYTNEINRTVLLCCQNSDNALEEKTGKTFTGYGRHADTSVELVTNGGPTTNVTGWTANRGTVEYENGQIKQTRSGGTGFGSYATITNAVIGQRYRLSAQIRSVSSRCDLYVTTAIESGSLLGLFGTAGETVDVTGVFTATATTLYVFTAVDNDGDVGYYNRVSVKAADYGDAPKVIPPFGTDNGVTFGGAISMNSSSYMCFPTGRTEERGRGRAIWGGGSASPNEQDVMDYLHIQSSGTAIDFGNLSDSRNEVRACGSSTRGVWAGGRSPHPSVTDVMDFVEIVTTANAVDFGNLTVARAAVAAVSNQTRGCFMAGFGPSNRNEIDYITIASVGNAIDFGDMLGTYQAQGRAMSPTRGLAAGNYGASNLIEYITIATTGNSTDFGDRTVAAYSATGTSDNTRGVFAGGDGTPNTTNVIDFVTMATTGNATDFGDLITANGSSLAATSNSIIGCIGGGQSNTNTIEKIIIQTTGDAVDYGDLSVGRSQLGATSDSHGGL